MEWLEPVDTSSLLLFLLFRPLKVVNRLLSTLRGPGR